MILSDELAQMPLVLKEWVQMDPVLKEWVQIAWGETGSGLKGGSRTA
jgi:hypothetical protein